MKPKKTLTEPNKSSTVKLLDHDFIYSHLFRFLFKRQYRHLKSLQILFDALSTDKLPFGKNPRFHERVPLDGEESRQHFFSYLGSICYCAREKGTFYPAYGICSVYPAAICEDLNSIKN